jgi:hypothetical protein
MFYILLELHQSLTIARACIEISVAVIIGCNIAMYVSYREGGGDFNTYETWPKMDNMGITRCVLLRRFQIWSSQMGTFPN